MRVGFRLSVLSSLALASAIAVAGCAPAGIDAEPATWSTVGSGLRSSAAPATGPESEDASQQTLPQPGSTSSTLSATTTVVVTQTSTEELPTSAPAAETLIPIRLRLDRRVDDQATEGFENLVQSVLNDPRGWVQAGFAFTFSETDHDYTVVLAEGSEVDALCLPYDTYGRFSCQIGPVVALNADRWRTAVDTWPASLDEYRTMLVNHEVGHLLGQHHPAERCPAAGEPAPVMAQQSSGVAPCAANPWPLPWEIACAAEGVEPLAPPYERDIVLTCGPTG